jgi:hypothetical protein
LCKVAQEFLSEYGRAVERAMDQYIAVMVTAIDDGTFKIPPKFTGIVWDACRDLKNIPENNQYCVKKRTLQVVEDFTKIHKSLYPNQNIL